jgi:hydrogenase small subunit
MPGFPDKFMPFMDEPPGATLSTAMSVGYGPFIRKMRGITNRTLNKEPRWRHNKRELTTGYDPRWGQKGGGDGR